MRTNFFVWWPRSRRSTGSECPRIIISGGNRRDRHCLGRTGSSGDCIWFNPFQNEIISEDDAARIRRFSRKIPEFHPRKYIFEPAPVTGLAQLGVRDDDLMPQVTLKVVETQRSELTNSDEITRMPRSVKRKMEEHSPRYTTAARNDSQAEAGTANTGEEINLNVDSNVDTTKKNSGSDRMMSALQRFAAA